MKIRKNALTAVIALLVITIIAAGFRFGMGMAVHSYDVCLLFTGKDWVNGNFFLKDWWFSTGTFGLPMLEQLLVTRLFGYHDSIILLLAAFNYAAMICSLLFVVYKYGRFRQVENLKIFLLLTVFVSLVPRHSMLLNAGTQNLAYIASMGTLCYCWVKREKETYCLAVIVGICMGVVAATNNMFLYTACAPVFLIGILDFWRENFKEKGRWLLATGGMSLVAYVFFLKVWECGRGAKVGGLSTVFTESEKIGDNLVNGFCNVLRLYGVDFWGKSVFSREVVCAVFGIIVFIKLTVELWRFEKSDKEKCLVELFLAMALINFGAYTFSTVIETSPDLHLLQPFLLGYTAAGMLAWMDNRKWFEKKSMIVLIAAFCTLILMFPDFTLKQPDNSGRIEAAEWLVENGYENGFATFWSAASVMYESNGELTISPVSCYAVNDEKICLHAQEWMNKSTWAKQAGNFLITDDTSEKKAGMTEEGILNTFGSWTDKQVFENIVVYTWDKEQVLE